MNKTTCTSDPFPTRLLMSHLHTIIPIQQRIVNIGLTKNVNELYVILTIIILPIFDPKVISICILGHSLDNNIVDSFQFAYKTVGRRFYLIKCVQSYCHNR